MTFQTQEVQQHKSGENILYKQHRIESGQQQLCRDDPYCPLKCIGRNTEYLTQNITEYLNTCQSSTL